MPVVSGHHFLIRNLSQIRLDCAPLLSSSSWMNILKDRQRVILAFIILSALALRLWGVTNPLADFHEFRQTYTALFAKFFYLKGMHILSPDIGVINYLNVSEFQLYPFIVALLYKIFGLHDIIGRLVSIFFSCLSVWLLGLTVAKFFTKRAGLIASALFAILPVLVFYGRTFMLESLMIFLAISAIYCTARYVDEGGWKFFLLASGSAALALLVKIPSIYLLLPLGFLFFNRYGFKSAIRPQVIVFFLVVLLPAFWWYYLYPRYFAAGIMDLRGATAYTDPTMEKVYQMQRMNPDTWSELFFNRFGQLYLAFAGFLFLVLDLGFRLIDGITQLVKGRAGVGLPEAQLSYESGKLKNRHGYSREQLVFIAWALGVMGFVVYFITPNMIHEYYQLPILPPFIALIAGYLDWIWKRYDEKKTKIAPVIFIVHAVLFAGILPYSFVKVSDRLKVNPLYYGFGQRIKAVVPADGLIIVMDPQPRTEVFYDADRSGYILVAPLLSMGSGTFIPLPNAESILEKQIEEFHAKGGRYLVTPYSQFSTYFPEIVKKLQSRHPDLLKNWKSQPGELTMPDGFPGFVFDLDARVR